MCPRWANIRIQKGLRSVSGTIDQRILRSLPKIESLSGCFDCADDAGFDANKSNDCTGCVEGGPASGHRGAGAVFSPDSEAANDDPVDGEFSERGTGG